MSIFDILAEQHLKVKCSDKEPFQWIYAVDDAWFQPDGWNLKIAISNGESSEDRACPPLFDDSLTGKRVQISRSDLDAASPQPSATLSMGGGRGGNQDKDNFLRRILQTTWHNSDHDTALRLCRFICDEFNQNQCAYGVCFCSFEYFWKNITQINRNQNAVLLDIRHQLAAGDSKIAEGKKDDQKALRDEWLKLLKATDLFTGLAEDGREMTKLGWYLHYALKFCAIPKFTSVHEAGIRPNHVVVVSSAINAPGSGRVVDPSRGDPMSDFTQVQQEIWATFDQTPEADGQNVHDLSTILPERFKFWPLGKSDRLRTGLAIFNNSFRNSASWDFKREQLIADMFRLWENHDVGHLGTEETRSNPDLRFAHWVKGNIRNASGENNAQKDASAYRLDLKGFHYFWDSAEGPVKFSVDSLLAFFEEAFCEKCVLQDRNGIDLITLPTSPGGSFLITIADVYWALKNIDGKEGRKPPEISLQFGGQYITLAFKITAPGVSKLAEIAQKPDAPAKGASLAIWHAVRGSLFLMGKLSPGQKSKQYRTNNGATWETVLKATPSTALPICFCDKEIKFHFKKA